MQCREDDHLGPRARYGNIEAPLAPLPVEWAEIHCHMTTSVGPVGNAEQHHIAFVALYCLKVLNKYGFGYMFA